jgi:catecholate siderophore receptor
MNGIVASNRSSSVSGRSHGPRIFKSNDGQIHVETRITSQFDGQTSSLTNTRFQSANRAGLLAAVSLASLMGATAASGQEGGLQLPTIDVTGDQGGYQATQSSLVRMPTALKDTPQTVNVVTQQLMKDQRVNTVVDTLRNVPGITFNAGEGGTQGDNINIRGYTARNDFYRDGVRDPGWYTRDAFSVQQVEVLKGPSSFLFGRGSTGGIVNMTSKLPEAKDRVDIEGTLSSAPGARTTVDVNKVWNDTISSRVIVLGTKSEVPGRNGPENERWGVAPSISAKLGDSTKATLSYLYQHDNNIPDYGIIALPASYFGTRYGAPAPVPRNTFYQVLGGPLPDTEQVDAHVGTFKLEHEFTNDIKLTNSTRYTNVDRFTRVRAVQTSTNPVNVFNAATGGVAGFPPQGANLNNYWVANTNHFQNNTVNQLLTNQTDLVAKFKTGFLEHTAVAGVELSQEQRDHYRTMITGAERVNIGSPNPYPAIPGVLAPTSTLTVGETGTKGVYASDQVKIGRYLELLGGLRFDRFTGGQETSTVNTGTNTAAVTPASLSSTNKFLSYRIGAVLHPTENSSVYYMRGTSANPPAEFVTLTNGQQGFDPVENLTDEVGAKIDFLQNALSLTGALFRTTQKNAYENLGTTAAPNYVAVGTTRVQGFEVGLVGRVTREWNVTLGYTYLDSQVVNTLTVANLGNRLANTPTNSGSIYTTYDVTPKWTVGGGAFYVGDRFTSTANAIQVPSYWRYDAMASYKVTEKFILQLNIYNIADTTNYESLAGAGWAVPGPSRYVSLTGRYTW